MKGQSICGDKAPFLVKRLGRFVLRVSRQRAGIYGLLRLQESQEGISQQAYAQALPFLQLLRTKKSFPCLKFAPAEAQAKVEPSPKQKHAREP